MKTRLALAILGLVIGTNVHAADVTPINATPPSLLTNKMSTAQIGDSVALGLLAEVNQHEIELAKQAQSKSVSAPVLVYANSMITAHSQNLTDTMALGANTEGAEVLAKRSENDQDLAELESLAGDAYENAYIEAMVKGHSDVLTMIDKQLLPMATTAVVKAHLTKTREHIQAHLVDAQALRDDAR